MDRWRTADREAPPWWRFVVELRNRRADGLLLPVAGFRHLQNCTPDHTGVAALLFGTAADPGNAESVGCEDRRCQGAHRIVGMSCRLIGRSLRTLANPGSTVRGTALLELRDKLAAGMGCSVMPVPESGDAMALTRARPRRREATHRLAGLRRRRNGYHQLKFLSGMTVMTTLFSSRGNSMPNLR